MTNFKLKIASRRSKLAMVQTLWVKEQLEKNIPNLEVSIEAMATQGDKILDVALAKIGDKGLFTKELEAQMLVGHADIAVHSLKDLPTNVKKYTYDKLEQHTTALKDLKKDYDKFGNLLDHPFYGIGITSTGEIVRTEIEEILQKTDALFELLLDRLSIIEKQLNIEINDFDSLKSYIDLFKGFSEKPELSKELYDQDDLDTISTQFKKIIPQIRIVNELEQKILQIKAFKQINS